MSNTEFEGNCLLIQAMNVFNVQQDVSSAFRRLECVVVNLEYGRVQIYGPALFVLPSFVGDIFKLFQLEEIDLAPLSRE